MNPLLAFAIVVLTFCFHYTCDANVQELSEGVNSMVIEHSMGQSFAHRGKLSVLSLADGRYSAEAEKKGISEADVEEFKTMLAKNDFYRIKIIPSSPNCSSTFVTAAIPSCELMKSGFKEDIILHLDDSSNCVVGVSYSSPVIALPRPCDPSKIKSATVLHTRIKIADQVNAQVVPLQVVGPRPPVLQNVNLGLEEEQKVQQKNQSFLQKYWYIVLAMVLYMFLGGSKEEPVAKGKEGRARAPAASTSS